MKKNRILLAACFIINVAVVANECPQLSGTYDECDDNQGMSIFDSETVTIKQTLEYGFYRVNINVTGLNKPFDFITDNKREKVFNGNNMFYQTSYCQNGTLIHNLNSVDWGMMERTYSISGNTLRIDEPFMGLAVTCQKR